MPFYSDPYFLTLRRTLLYIYHFLSSGPLITIDVYQNSNEKQVSEKETRTAFRSAK